VKDIARPDIKPAFAVRNVPVALATDENYLPYLKVTINSAIASSPGSNLDIIVLHAGIPEDAILDFTAGYASVGNASVRFVDISDELEKSGLSDYRQTARLPLSACYRLLLPRVLAAYGKVVYLDVDVAVCRDLGELYATDLGDCYFAAALDVVHTTRPEYLSWAAKWGFEEWDGYVNMGVLVMNLERFRREPVFDRLLPVVLEASKWLCDQDALNFVCKGAIAPLDPRWNVQLGDYCLEKQIALTGEEMWIAHYTGSQKPWTTPYRRYSNLWWRHVDDLSFAVATWRKVFDVGDTAVCLGDGVAVSVIVPVYNAEPYLAQALVSLAAQTLRNIEVICVDDGSTDGSRAICEKFASFDSRIRIFSQKNLGAAVARNRGIEEARGRWLFFGDADDFCRHDMLEELVRAGQNDCHDVVVAGRMIMDCGRSMLVREVGVPRGYFGKGRNVNCHTDGINVFAGLGFAPWNKLFRRAFVIEKGIKFHNNPSCDDVFFVFSSLIAAESIAFVDRSYYYYRANLPTSQMGLADKNPTNFLVALRKVKSLLDSESLRLKEQFYSAAVHSCFDHLFARKTSEGRRMTFAALQNGGLESLCFPQIDSRTFDLGSMRRFFDLTVSGGSLADVIAEYYQENYAKVADLTARLEAAKSAVDKLNVRMDGLKAKLEEAWADVVDGKMRHAAREKELKAKLEEAWADVVDGKMRYAAREAELKDKLEEAWAKDADCKARYIAREAELKQKLEESWACNKKLSSDAASTVEMLTKQLELARKKCEAIAADRDRLQCIFDNVMSVVGS